MTELRHIGGIGKEGEGISFTCASGPVIIEDGKVLLNKHGEDEFWKFPGGSVHDEFNLKDNAIREVKEECGIDVEVLDEEPCFLIFEREYKTIDAVQLASGIRSQAHEGVKEYVFLIHYLAKRIGDIKLGSDVREYKWIEVNDLPEDIAPNIKPVLNEFKKRGKI